MLITATPPMLTALGALAGGSASYLSLKMFFGPSRRLHVFGLRLPFTPGLFPHIQPQFSERIAVVLHESLLTAGDFHYLATKLVTSETIDVAIERVITSLVGEFRNTTNLHRLAHDAGALASEAVGQTMRVVVQRALSGDSQVFDIPDLVDKAMDYLLGEFEVTPKLATYMTERLLEGALSPASLRTRLIEFLTPDAVEALAKAIKRYTSGGLGLLLYFVNLKDGLTKFRIFLEDDPERAEQMLTEIMGRAGIRQMVEKEILTFSLRQLPWSTITFLKQTTTTFLVDYLTMHEETLVPQVLERLEIDQLITDAIVRMDPDKIPPPLLKRVRQEIAGFIQRYLDRDLSALIEQVIGALDLPTVFADKVRSLPSPLLERMIAEFGQRRLTGMVLAGAGLGGIVGFTFSLLL